MFSSMKQKQLNSDRTVDRSQIRRTTSSRTHLDLDIPAVDDLYDAHDVVKHQTHFLTIV